MLSMTNELIVRSSVLAAYGDRMGELMTGFVLDVIESYSNSIHWEDLEFPGAWPGEIQLKFSGIREKETGICREYDLLTLKPAEGVAIVRPGDSEYVKKYVEICVDDWGDPYYFGIERLGDTFDELKVRVRTKVLYKVLKDVRRGLSIFDPLRGGDRLELARILQGGIHG